MLVYTRRFVTFLTLEKRKIIKSVGDESGEGVRIVYMMSIKALGLYS
jgi:hypothetical protein